MVRIYFVVHVAAAVNLQVVFITGFEKNHPSCAPPEILISSVRMCTSNFFPWHVLEIVSNTQLYI